MIEDPQGWYRFKWTLEPKPLSNITGNTTFKSVISGGYFTEIIKTGSSLGSQKKHTHTHTQGWFYFKPAGAASERYLSGSSIYDHKRRVWFGIRFGNNAMKTGQPQMIESHISNRRLCWETQYMEKSWCWYVFFISPLHWNYMQTFFQGSAAVWKKTNTHTHMLYRQPLPLLPNWCLASPSQTRKVNTRGLPCVFAGGRVWQHFLLHFLPFVHYRSVFFHCSPTHPLSSSGHRASLCFERTRHHQWWSHPAHHQRGSYSRKERTPGRRKKRHKPQGLILGKWCCRQIKARPSDNIWFELLTCLVKNRAANYICFQ